MSVLRDAAYRSVSEVDIEPARGRVSRLFGLVQGKDETRYFEVPKGQHQYRITIESGGVGAYAVALGTGKRVVPKFALATEEPLPGVAAAGANEAAAKPTAAAHAWQSAQEESMLPARALAQRHQAAAAASAAPISADTTKANPQASPVSSDSGSGNGAAQDPEPLAIASSDGGITASTRALADGIASGYAALERPTAFHRVAVPYFSELGDDVEKHKLGRLVSALLAGELSRHPPFVVVERERLDQIMR